MHKDEFQYKFCVVWILLLFYVDFIVGNVGLNQPGDLPVALGYCISALISSYGIKVYVTYLWLP